MVEQRVFSDGSVVEMSPAEAQRSTALTLRERVANISMAAPRPVRPETAADSANGYVYAVVADITLGRLHCEMAATFAVVLLAISDAAYGVFLRSFRDLAIGATGLALSLWGVRSLLLGNAPGVTTKRNPERAPARFA